MLNDKQEKLLLDKLDIQQRLIERQRDVIEEFKTLVAMMEERDKVVRIRKIKRGGD